MTLSISGMFDANPTPRSTSRALTAAMIGFSWTRSPRAADRHGAVGIAEVTLEGDERVVRRPQPLPHQVAEGGRLHHVRDGALDEGLDSLGSRGLPASAAAARGGRPIWSMPVNTSLVRPGMSTALLIAVTAWSVTMA